MDSSTVAPLSDAKVFKEYPARHSPPQREIFNVDIVDSQSGALQVLDSLQRSGPLHFKGWVPIEETIYASAKDSGKLIYIFGEIIEWTHQYDPTRPKRPIFWLKSYGVGWYKIESVTTGYEQYFTPLVKVCSYLDVLVQLVVEMKIKDDLNLLIPQVAVLLSEPESMVSQMLQMHRMQLLELGASDSIIRESNFYKSWAADSAGPLGPSGQSRASHSPGVSEHAEYNTFTDDMGTITDSDIDVQSPHSNHHLYYSRVDDTNNGDVNASSPPLAASKPLLPIVSYDMADREVIPELETKVEIYEELPAPCPDDFCFFHSVVKEGKPNAISTDIQLLSSKFEPPRSRPLLSQLNFAVKIEPGLEYPREESSKSGSSLVSEAGSFFCPVQGCQTTLSNTTIPTSREFIALVAHHISTHDLKEGNTERALRTYLAKPWKRPVRPKAWDVTAKQLNTKTPTLNLHAYWMLNAKKNNDQRAPSHIPTTALARSTRKRAISRARIQTSPSSPSTTFPHSTPVVRQMRGVSTSSVTQFLEPQEATTSTTPSQRLAIETTAESRRTSLVQKTIATSASFDRKSSSRERYHRHERDSSGSPVLRIRSKRRVSSNDSNHSGNEDIGPGRKRQHVGHPLRIDVSSEDDDGAGTGMRMGIAHGSRRVQSLSRGRATVRRNEMQPTRRSSRSRSIARLDMISTGTALRRSARSRSKPRPFGSASVNENQSSSGRTQGRSKSGGQFDNFDDNYTDEQLELGSENELDGSDYGPEPVYEEVTIQERGRSRTPKRIERAVVGSNVRTGLISKLWNVYRAPPKLLATTTIPMFMRCYRCQALIRASDEHQSCMELGSEEFPVVLTTDDS
ncbi:hypothetical protein BKA57DRAFT_449074 [Linnemannia elongata]|nr:hypothetical protein BKA57DRAFT_449074 [Linnemannia elongata]